MTTLLWTLWGLCNAFVVWQVLAHAFICDPFTVHTAARFAPLAISRGSVRMHLWHSLASPCACCAAALIFPLKGKPFLANGDKKWISFLLLSAASSGTHVTPPSPPSYMLLLCWLSPLLTGGGRHLVLSCRCHEESGAFFLQVSQN